MVRGSRGWVVSTQPPSCDLRKHSLVNRGHNVDLSVFSVRIASQMVLPANVTVQLLQLAFVRFFSRT